jgi:hypothetical protein
MPVTLKKKEGKEVRNFGEAVGPYHSRRWLIPLWCISCNCARQCRAQLVLGVRACWWQRRQGVCGGPSNIGSSSDSQTPHTASQTFQQPVESKPRAPRQKTHLNLATTILSTIARPILRLVLVGPSSGMLATPFFVQI